MLSIKRCPHTGVLNLFDLTEPHFAVGSIARASGQTKYLWRCYSAGTDRAGRATDLKDAEHALIASYEDMVDGSGRRVHAA